MHEKGLGKNILAYRKKKGLSQEKVAEYMGVSRQAVTKWESDVSRPSSDNLMKLAELFGIKLDVLLGNEEAETVKEDSGHIATQKSAWLFIAVSAVCLITYMIAGTMKNVFSIGSMICIFVVAVPVQLFLHIYFDTAIKNDSFTGIAGFKENISYDSNEVKKMLVRIDVRLQAASAMFVFLFCIISLFDFPVGWIKGYLFFLYIAEFMGIILSDNYKMIDRIYTNDKDRKYSRGCFPVTVVYSLFLLFDLCVMYSVFEIKGIENNTMPAIKLSILLIISIAAATCGYVHENKWIEKLAANGKAYCPNKMSLVCILGAVVLSVGMLFVK